VTTVSANEAKNRQKDKRENEEHGWKIRSTENLIM